MVIISQILKSIYSKLSELLYFLAAYLSISVLIRDGEANSFNIFLN